MYKVSFYVQKKDLNKVKQAMFDQGAGRIGNYEYCCWQTLGKGQFKPTRSATPYIGKKEKLNRVSEYLVEMVCEDGYILAVIKALKKAHPYEEPPYMVVRLEDFSAEVKDIKDDV